MRVTCRVALAMATNPGRLANPAGKRPETILSRPDTTNSYAAINCMLMSSRRAL